MSTILEVKKNSKSTRARVRYVPSLFYGLFSFFMLEAWLSNHSVSFYSIDPVNWLQVYTVVKKVIKKPHENIKNLYFKLELEMLPSFQTILVLFFKYK